MSVWRLTLAALNAMGGAETLRFSSGEYDGDVYPYLPYIAQPALYGVRIRSGGLIPVGDSVNMGEVLLGNKNGRCNFLADYAIDGRTAVLDFVSDAGVVTPIVTGTIKAAAAFIGDQVSIKLRDPQESLSLPHPQAIYTGSSYSGAVMDDLPVGYWRLGDDNAVALDESGYGNNGAYLGGYTQGQAGLVANDQNKSVLLNGSSGYVRVPTAAILRPATVWTLECVFRTPAAVSSAAALVGSETLASNVMFAMGLCDGAVPGLVGARPFIGYFAGGAWRAAFGPTNLTAATKYHLTGSFDGTTLRLYLNGVLIASNVPAVAYAAQVQDILLGRRWDALSWFDGTLDECAIYATALSAPRIAQHAGFV